jgi:hypothetical protein
LPRLTEFANWRPFWESARRIGRLKGVAGNPASSGRVTCPWWLISVDVPLGLGQRVGSCGVGIARLRVGGVLEVDARVVIFEVPGLDMAKVRVYELAKELGVDSRGLMLRLGELGEFVRSASSAIEPDVVRRLRAELPAVRPSPSGGSWPVGPVRSRLSAPRPRPRPNPFATGRQQNPFVPPVVSLRESTVARGDQAVRACSDAEQVFGAQAVRATSREVVNGRETYPDGYGWRWQQHIISHDTYVELLQVGVEPHEADLAYECLIAGLRPAELMTRLGEKTVLEWLRDGHPAAKVAKTLEDCRRDPNSRHLVVEFGGGGAATG